MEAQVGAGQSVAQRLSQPGRTAEPEVGRAVITSYSIHYTKLYEAQQFNAMIAGMKQEWIDSVADRNVDARAAIDELWSIARDYEAGKR